MFGRNFREVLFGFFCLCILKLSIYAQHCANVAPGVAKLSSGLDITKLDLLPLEVQNDDGYRRPVIDLTCSKKRLWTNPFNKDKYDLPTQVWIIKPIPTSTLFSGVNIYKTSRDIKRTMSASAGASFSFLYGSFSSSGSYKKMQHEIKNMSRYVEEVTYFTASIQVDIKPYWEMSLGRYAQSYVDRQLPKSYSKNAAAYRKFIDIFGTHYFASAKFGGLLRLYMLTESDYYKKHTDRQVKAQAKGSFLNLLKAHGGYSRAVTGIDTEFKKKTQEYARYFGGDTNLLSSSGIKSWQPTVAGNPWIFGGNVEPISNLIKDPFKMASMKKAVKFHLRVAMLKDFQRVLFNLYSKYGQIASLKSLAALISRLISSKEPSQQNLVSIRRQLDAFLVPAWFKNNVKLCYTWYPDGDSQCSAPSRQLCAKPGAMTAYYRDDTDGRSGGCRMRWGLVTTGFIQNWLNNVKVCYKWHPDGDGGQCGGGVGRLLCAKVNSYTTYYRDDTDSRMGGCQMSWMLSVPGSVPYWMKNLKLCYQWYPDGDAGQCGHGRRYCAKANTWTKYYRDDTDSRMGGCQMRWGLTI